VIEVRIVRICIERSLCRRIIDDRSLLGAVAERHGGEPGKVAGLPLGWRHDELASDLAGDERILEAGEEEELVFYDRAAQGGAEFVARAAWEQSAKGNNFEP
jgi:hypothetical protein